MLWHKLRSILLAGCWLSGSANTVFLPMRDGTLLHTDFDLPLSYKPGDRLATVMERSPYGDGAEELIADVFGEVLGYVSVRQDVRGTKKSNGSFGIWHDSRDDAYDTMAWIVAQPWSDGAVFTTGASADAIDELAQLSGPHPALRGQVNIFATSDGWGTFYPGGAYREALIDGWLKQTVPKDFARCDALVRSEEQPDGQWWSDVNGSMWYQNVVWPSLMWAGWYDIFQQGNIAAWEGFQHSSALAVRGESKLVIDPCGHCQAAANLFPHDLIFGRVLLPILMAFDMMSNQNMSNTSWPPVPEAVNNLTLYVMGGDEGEAAGNFWTTLPEFPATTPTPMFLHDDGLLSRQAPDAGPSTLEYAYDPSDPVPTIGGNNLLIPCGPLDQRPNEAAGRPDILIFTSEVLDAPLAVVGELTASVFFSTDVLDTDIVVKLIDVYPADANSTRKGASILVADGIARARWRDFPATNELHLLSGDPGDVYSVNLTLWHTAYVFAAGHSVRVHVQSSNFPRFFPNPNTGALMNVSSPSEANVTAHTSIHLDAAHPTSITLPVVPLSALPPFDVGSAVDSMLARHEARWAGNTRSRMPGEDMRAWLDRRVAKALTAATTAAARR